MKKWEKPKLQDLRLEQTESAGPIEISCPSCANSDRARLTLDPIPITCYRCPCCTSEFHSNNYNNSSSEALQAARSHIKTMHVNGCSS